MMTYGGEDGYPDDDDVQRWRRLQWIWCVAMNTATVMKMMMCSLHDGYSDDDDDDVQRQRWLQRWWWCAAATATTVNMIYSCEYGYSDDDDVQLWRQLQWIWCVVVNTDTAIMMMYSVNDSYSDDDDVQRRRWLPRWWWNHQPGAFEIIIFWIMWMMRWAPWRNRVAYCPHYLLFYGIDWWFHVFFLVMH